jgi:hypothetical protein
MAQPRHQVALQFHQPQHTMAHLGRKPAIRPVLEIATAAITNWIEG